MTRKTQPQRQSIAAKPKELQRHAPFYLGTATALFSLTSLMLGSIQLSVVLATVLFFAVYLLLTAIRLPQMSADYLCDHAASEDESAPIILLVTLVTVAVSMGSLFSLTNQQTGETTLEFCLSLASVSLGWISIHTMCALHYAHLYWQPEDVKLESDNADARRGLDFPETPDPSIVDFLYFAFVIGMTAQTSDVQITSTAMRRTNLIHAIVSFFFNTVLVAASVNVAMTFFSSGK